MATINPHTTRATGTVLTAAIYNTDHQNHITNALSLNTEVVADTAELVNHEGRIVALEGGGFTIPFGVMWEYGGTAAPSGWLLCFGQAVSRATYANLFAVIGTTFGPGDGSTTFNVPDFRGRVAAGQDDMGGVSANRLTVAGGLDGDVLGGAGGAETVALSIANLAAHTHTGPSHTHTGPSHTHTFSDTATTGNGSVNHTHSATASAALGSGQLIPQGTATPNGGVVNIDGASGSLHTHSVTIGGTTSAGGTGATGAGGTGATSSVGSGTAHANVQPTLIVNKIIYTGV